MTISVTTATRNSWLSTLETAAGNSAKLLLCSGTRPATGTTTPTPLVTLIVTGGDLSLFTSVTNGVGTCNAIAAVAATSGGAAPGTSCTWARLNTSANAFVADFTVTATAGGGDLTMDNTAVISSPAATITPGTITITAPGA